MSPLISGGGGGGTVLPPLARNVGQVELDFGQDVVQADGAKHLTLSYSAGDASLVDLTDPANPTVVTAGLYAFTLTMALSGTTSDPWYGGLLADDNFYSVTAREGVGSGGGPYPFLGTTVVWWGNASDPFAALAQITGADTIHPQGSIYLQLIR